jgi:ParB family transcriptional regulator, chromosome partitioning protein
MRQPLGRGLDAILGSGPVSQVRTAVPQEPPAGETRGKPLMVAIERVVAGRGQPRRRFDDEPLEELAASIREHGILQPLVVVATGGNYELIAGERRLRAAARAGLEQVPVVFRETSRDGEMLELALVENLQREDLGPLERARAYERLLEQHGLVQEDIARKVGKSRTAIANTLRLLGLPGPVLDAIEQNLLSEGHARALLALPTATRQIEAMQIVVRKSLSVRDTEQLVRDWTEESVRGEAKSTKPATRGPGPVETRLSRVLGTKVRVRGGTKKGRIEIEYYSQEELMRLIDVLSSREGG